MSPTPMTIQFSMLFASAKNQRPALSRPSNIKEIRNYFLGAIASFAAINFLNHVRKTTGYMRDVWLCVAATASGFGIWSTHFIAMLAYSPGIPSGYNIILTLLSLVAAILLTGVGLSIASGNRVPAGRWIGGATVGGGIAAMHYTGMAAFEIAGRIQWDPVLVGVSIVLGAAIGATALPAGLRDASMKWKAIACTGASSSRLSAAR